MAQNTDLTPNSTGAISAIESGLREGGDEQNWHAEEFLLARTETEFMNIQWDFQGRAHTLKMLQAGMIGGTKVEAR